MPHKNKILPSKNPSQSRKVKRYVQSLNIPDISPLDLISTNDLINELTNRFHSCIFIGQSHEECDGAPGEVGYWFKFKGNHVIGLGMCQKMITKISLDMARKDGDLFDD